MKRCSWIAVWGCALGSSLLSGCLFHTTTREAGPSVIGAPSGGAPPAGRDPTVQAEAPGPNPAEPARGAGDHFIAAESQSVVPQSDYHPHPVRISASLTPPSARLGAEASSANASAGVQPTRAAPPLTSLEQPSVAKAAPEPPETFPEQVVPGRLLAGPRFGKLNPEDQDPTPDRSSSPATAPCAPGSVQDGVAPRSADLPRPAALGARGPLQLDRLCFCSRIEGFGNYEALPTEHAFQAGVDGWPGEWVHVYAEVRNARSVVRNESHETTLSTTLEIRDAKQQTVVLMSPEPYKDRSRSLRQDCFLNIQFHVPPHLPPGTWTLVATVRDITPPSEEEPPVPPEERTARATLDFRVVPANQSVASGMSR